jgi:small basic protein
LLETTTTHHYVIDETFEDAILVSSTLFEIILMKMLYHDQDLDLELLLDIIGIHPILD